MTVNRTLGCAGDFKHGYHVTYASVVLSSVILTQNLLTLVTIYQHRALHTATNLIIVSLRIGDILTAINFLVVGVIFYPGIITLSNDASFLDTFVLGSFSFTQILSCLHFGIAAIDRYMHIVRPFVYIKHVTKRRVMHILIGLWLTSLTNLWLPLIIRIDYYNEVCILINPPVAYFAAATCIHYTVIIIVFVCDFKIARLAFRRKKSANVRRMQNSSDIAILENNYNAAIASAKFFAASFGTYSACTLPANWFMCINYFIPLPYIVYIPSLCLFLANPIFRFYVHIYMSKDFRQCLKTMLLRQKRCCS